jgi:squalene cyclase
MFLNGRIVEPVMPLNFLRSILVTLLVIATHAQAAIDLGNQWLKLQQQPDGRVYSTGTTSTPIQSTAEAIKTLSLTEPTPDLVTLPAREFIHGQNLEHLEDLHCWLAFAPSDVETKTAMIHSINRYSRANGGFGDYIGHEHSVLATVFALNGLRDLTAPNTASTQTAIQYLLTTQRNDGGWAEEGNYSSIYITALVSQLLQRYRLEFNVSNATAKATQFLLQQQKTGGGWETSLDSAQALLAIILNSTNASTYQVALEKLNAAQAAKWLLVQRCIYYRFGIASFISSQ